MSKLFEKCAREQTFADRYKCCLDRCGGAPICKALCRNVYPGSIPEDCAAQIGCMHAEYFDTQCIEEQALQFRKCCFDRCRARKWSDERTIGLYFDTDTPLEIDCFDYCRGAEKVLVNTRFGSPPGS